LLFEELRSRGFLDNALVVITSDHGEHFGENGVVGHGNSLYRTVLEVPLLISFNGVIPGGTRVQDVVSLRDVAATLLDLSGIQPEPIAGQSLSRYWMGKTLDIAARSGPVLSQVTTAIRQPDWLNSDGPMVSVVENGLHYIKNFGKNKEELFDFVNDPREERNLVDSPEAASSLPHLRSRIAPATTTFLEVSR
jgi:arylsulfatase A-like enzyme